MPRDVRHFVYDLVQAARGYCMGAADVVPGVSGGTVALILGIYERLMTGLSRFDLDFLDHLRNRRWLKAAEHVDLRFLVSLGCGILLGVASMTSLMNWLLTTPSTRPFTLAAFFGMIFASGLVIAKLVKAPAAGQRMIALGLGLIGAAFAWWLTTLRESHITPSYPYLFLCATIAICAMILPGISGAMLLLILGVYLYMAEIPYRLLAGEQVLDALLSIGVFGLGCAVGLLSFSKLLRWLLQYHYDYTMALLCGFMFGALRKVWPFQRDLTPSVDDLKHKVFEPVFPAVIDAHVLAVTTVAMIAIAGVLLVDFFTRRGEKS